MDWAEVITEEIALENATMSYHHHGKRALINFQRIHKVLKGY